MCREEQRTSPTSSARTHFCTAVCHATSSPAFDLHTATLRRENFRLRLHFNPHCHVTVCYSPHHLFFRVVGTSRGVPWGVG